MARNTKGGMPSIVHASCDGSYTLSIQDSQCQGAFVVLTGTADAIPFPGNIAVNSAGVNAMTLNQPVAGPQPTGDDGKSIFVLAQNAAIHTITTAANGIIGSKHLATWTAAIGNCIELRAYGGVWVPVMSTGVAVT